MNRPALCWRLLQGRCRSLDHAADDLRGCLHASAGGSIWRRATDAPILCPGSFGGVRVPRCLRFALTGCLNGPRGVATLATVLADWVIGRNPASGGTGPMLARTKKEGGSGPLRVGLVVLAAGQFTPVAIYKLLPGGGGLPSGYLPGYLDEDNDLLPGQAFCLAYQLCGVTVHACFLLQILDDVGGRFKHQLHSLDYIINENSYIVKRKKQENG